MKHALLLALLSTLLACGASKDNANEPGLDTFQGQWVVINYWAQWCKPCIKEIPELNTLNQQYAQVTVLGVNYDGATGEDLAAQLEKLGIEFATLATDPASKLGTPRPVVLPTTLILDPTGQLSATLVGPQTLATLTQATGQSVDQPHHE